jgi:hypothetical protein
MFRAILSTVSFPQKVDSRFRGNGAVVTLQTKAWGLR